VDYIVFVDIAWASKAVGKKVSDTIIVETGRF
jgi:hypothetical protein